MSSTYSINKRSRIQRAKTFTGCWTCRARKVKCDLTRPSCTRCERSGLKCGGYDIKLRWSKPVWFNEYGIQISTASNNRKNVNEMSPSPVSGINEENNQYQRRNISFVKYKEEYVFHEDMDDELSMLHAPPADKIEDNKTWIIKKFGVFKGCDNDKANQITKKRKKSATSETPSQRNECSGADDEDTEHLSLNSFAASESSENLGANKNDNKVDHYDRRLELEDSLPKSGGGIVGFEWLFPELLDDVIISALALQRGTEGIVEDRYSTDGISFLPSKVSTVTALSSDQYRSQLPSGAPDARNASDNQDPLQETLEGFFTRPLQQDNRYNLSLEPSSVSMVEIGKDFPSQEGVSVKESKASVSPNLIVARTMTDIFCTNLKTGQIVNYIGNVIPSLKAENNKLRTHALASHLMKFYVKHVARLMPAVAVKQNIWQTIYLPRALQALGELMTLGKTSNSKNCMLNTLLALSCFALQKNYVNDPTIRGFFLNLGIELRNQADNFLMLCLKVEQPQEKYKEVLTSLMAINYVDVVWGIVSKYQPYLNICGDIIQRRMQLKPHLSEKAKALHETLAFSKIVQDSTTFDDVHDNEIMFKADKDQTQFTTPGTEHDESLLVKNSTKKNIGTKSSGRCDIELSLGHLEANDKMLTEPGSLKQDKKEKSSFFTTLASEIFLTTSQNRRQGYISDSLPNSLLLLFSDCVMIVRHIVYFDKRSISIPKEFSNIIGDYEKKLMKWKPDCNFYKDTSTKTFISDKAEGIYHHTMSFYNGLLIYYFSLVRHLTDESLQPYVVRVLSHLKSLNEITEEKALIISTSVWQGFIAGCSCISPEVQNDFKDWATRLGSSGIGSYWGLRQIMYEVWRRKQNGKEGATWFSLQKEMKIILLLL
ncbi:hypothetical protein KAFR_0L02130 [Kazachstania africana CBS 2517]|uniref:Zn(2)-C6 fungal-type domain-containing protein n=1 Tax=Kazachstania africana (strain ATCC 22294 / BCRC 22015 / CBS 2517 / CECT 1963 / NBRC 1671 / NRRL Y-8276) TaxID=1071382 RepID=H2B2H4_KAZAF|nr:hypothetical protein KAFR_0L02130 [Kazachstania africana CBS 2517]CCF60824.1 hypothetical protein KAFR_0L02130 [Kazachstania africana CBS 2517]